MTLISPNWSQIQWAIPLGLPPTIASIGIGVHGRFGNERFLLPDLWALHFYQYEAKLQLGDSVFPIFPCYVSIIPPNMPIEYHYEHLCKHLYVHFRCATNPGCEQAWIPAMQDLGTNFPALYASTEQMIGAAQEYRFQAQARLWDVLCRLTMPAASTQEAPPNADTGHPAVRRAVQLIEVGLSEPLVVEKLAQNSGVSYSYLGRLFQEAYGKTVVGYIRDRRVQRAEHLLLHSTLPIKAIAAAVAIPDLHLFNKTIRRELGSSPSAVRRSTQASFSEDASD